jgi:hypothetical protein
VNILTLKPESILLILETACFQSVESIFLSQQTLLSLLLNLLLLEARTQTNVQGHFPGSTFNCSLRPEAGRVVHTPHLLAKCP